MILFSKLPLELTVLICEYLTDHDISQLRQSSPIIAKDRNLRDCFFKRLLRRIEADNGNPFYLPFNSDIYPPSDYYPRDPTITDRLILSGSLEAIEAILNAADDLGSPSRRTILSLRFISRACYHSQLSIISFISVRLDLHSLHPGKFINPFLAILFAPKESNRRAALSLLHTHKYDLNAPTICQATPSRNINDALDNSLCPPGWTNHNRNLTPLHCASWERDIDMVRWLLEDCHVNPDPIWSYGTVDFVDYFGSPTEKSIQFYLTPLNVAFLRNSLTHHLQRSLYFYEMAFFALIFTTKEEMEERLEIVKVLAKAGASIDGAQPLGRTPLLSLQDIGYFYIRDGREFCRLFLKHAVPLLLDLGANLSPSTATTLLNETISTAAYYYYSPFLKTLIRRLLQAGANPNYLDCRNDLSGVHMMESFGRYIPMSCEGDGKTLVGKVLLSKWKNMGSRWVLPRHAVQILNLLVEFGADEEELRRIWMWRVWRLVKLKGLKGLIAKKGDKVRTEEVRSRNEFKGLGTVVWAIKAWPELEGELDGF